jgi:hypothetical protein
MNIVTNLRPLSIRVPFFMHRKHRGYILPKMDQIADVSQKSLEIFLITQSFL